MFNSVLIAAGKKWLHHLCHHNRLRIVTFANSNRRFAVEISHQSDAGAGKPANMARDQPLNGQSNDAL